MRLEVRILKKVLINFEIILFLQPHTWSEHAHRFDESRYDKYQIR